MLVVFLSIFDVFTRSISPVLLKSYVDDEKNGTAKAFVWNAFACIVITAAILMINPGSVNWADFGHTILSTSPESICFVLALLCDCLGLCLLECSVSTAVSQVANGLLSTMVVAVYLIAGKITSVTDMISPLQIAGTAVIVVGLILLAAVINRENKVVSESRTKPKRAALFLLVPLMGSLLESASAVQEALYLSGDFAVSYTVEEDLLITTILFTAAGIAAEIYIFTRERKWYNPFRKSELRLFETVATENLGAYLATYAIEENPIIAFPIMASFSAVTVLFSRLILKEKLSRKKYICTFIVIAGIIILGFTNR